MNLYEINQGATRFIVRAKTPRRAAGVAFDVIDENFPRAAVRVKMGEPVGVNPMTLPEDNGEGYVPVSAGYYRFNKLNGRIALYMK